MKLSDAARLVPLQVLREGEFNTLAFLSDPEPEMLVFVESRQFLRALNKCAHAACLITTPELSEETGFAGGLAVYESPRRAFHEIQCGLAALEGFYWRDFPSEIDPTAQVHPTAFVAPRNVRIGAGTVIGPKAVVLERCSVGEDCVIQPGAVLGSTGFQATRTDGWMAELPHAGSLEIGAGTHVFANAVVALSAFRRPSTVGEQSRIGSCAFVSHNVDIGSKTFVGHGCVVNGHVRIGDGVWIGPGSTLANGISVGEGARITMGSVVIRTVQAGEHVSGNFAVEHQALLRHTAALR